MPPRNPLRENDQPREETTGDQITNVRTERTVRIAGPDGNPQEFTTEIHDSRPDENGNFNIRELINAPTDHAGNPLPEDPRSLIISHSGLYITSPQQLGHCTSWLHPANQSRNILLGQDGRATAGGAVCSRCDSWLGTIYTMGAIFAIAILLGVWSGAGLF